MLETELKCIITEDTYYNIKNLFKWDWIKEQINSYYSDPCGALKKHGITFRIRTKDNKNKLQIKQHKYSPSPAQISEESEYDIDNIPSEFPKSEVSKFTGIAVKVSLLGSLKTLRHSLMYCDGVEICLDKNTYLDKTDYEIEIEYTSPIPNELLKILQESGIEFKEKASGKCTRFMMRLAAILRGEE